MSEGDEAGESKWRATGGENQSSSRVREREEERNKKGGCRENKFKNNNGQCPIEETLMSIDPQHHHESKHVIHI